MAKAMEERYNREHEAENLDSIRFSVEELRRIGNFNDRSDEELEVISELLAKCSLIIFKTLKDEKRRRT